MIKGSKCTDDTRKKMSESKKGIPRPEDVRKKISDAQKGEKNHRFGKSSWNKGLKCPQFAGDNNPAKRPEVREKISESKMGDKNPMKRPEIIAKISGKNSPFWQGGISFLPYCYRFNNKLREEIRDRDNRICQNCDKTEQENNRKLSVHHIHYDKENCYPDLISLCNACNAKVNQNRDYWEEHFMKILEYREILEKF